MNFCLLSKVVYLYKGTNIAFEFQYNIVCYKYYIIILLIILLREHYQD